MKILNASPGFGLPLTEQELRDFLSDARLNMHLGTADENKEPNIHPIWYYFDTSNNKLYVETSKNSKKLSNIRKNKTVYFCIDEPSPPYRGARGKGEVTIHEDIDYNLPISEKIMIRYLGNLEHPMAKSLLNNVKSGDSVILEIIPNYYSTWDYSKKG